MCNFVFVRLAHVDDLQVVAAIEPALQFGRRDLFLFWRFRLLPGSHAAEFFVIDQLFD